MAAVSGSIARSASCGCSPNLLSSRLASYYERAGRVRTLAGSEGSVTLISAISPPGGDLTEPVTRHTQRFTECFWTLDKALAESRMFPAISLRESYSHLPDQLITWWTTTISPEWPALRRDALALLDEADRAETTARLIGIESLPQRQQWLLAVARLFEDGFLRQSAFDARDASCSPARQFRLLRLLLRIHSRGLTALDRGMMTERLLTLPVLGGVPRAKSEIGEEELSRFDQLETDVEEQFAKLDAAPRAAA